MVGHDGAADPLGEWTGGSAVACPESVYQPWTVMLSMRSVAAVRASSEIGAEPADSSAAAWPSSEMTYWPNAFARSAVSWSWYCWQKMW